MCKSKAVRQKGITLIEILLVAVIVAASIVGVFMFSQNARLTAAVSAEQAQVEQTVKTLQGLFANQPNYGSLSASYLNDKASGSGLVFREDASGNVLLNTQVGQGRVIARIESANVTFPPSGPATIVRPSPTGNAFAISYSKLSTKECINLTSAVAGSSILAHAKASSSVAHRVVAMRGKVSDNKDNILAGCTTPTSAPTALLVMYFQGPKSASAALPPSTPLAQCRPVRETQSTGCPTGQTGSIVQERMGNCTGPGNSLVYSVWTTIEDTCVDAAVAPPSEIPTAIVDDCTTTTFTRSTACAAPSVGQITETRTVNGCTNTSTPWTETGRTCNTPPVATCTPTTARETIACPAGQGGQIVRERSSTCATPTSTPTWPAWSTAHVVSSNCSSNCAVAGTCCTALRENRTVVEPCPAGTYGDSGREEERFRGCANPTTPLAWTSWLVVDASSTCLACPPSTAEDGTRWVDRTESCPAGSGNIEFEAEQARTRTTSYSCPAGTTSLPAPTVGAWSSWTDTGRRRNVDTSNCGGGDCYDYRLEAMGTLDTHDAFFTIQYTINGVIGGCTASRRDDGITGAGNCRGGNNGVFDIGQWSLRAAPGDTYAEIGSTSGWEQERHQFWGWDHHLYTKNSTPCATGCRFEVERENYSPLGTGYQTFWRNEYTDSSGTRNATLYCQESTSSPGQLSCNASGPGFNFSGVYNGSTLAAALPVGWKWMRERELGLPSPTGDAGHLLSNPGAAITFDFQIDGTGIGSGSYVRSAACTTTNSCSIPAGTAFNWTVGSHSCTYTQPTATTVSNNGFFTAVDSVEPTLGQAQFSCSPPGHVTDPSTYSSGQDVSCDSGGYGRPTSEADAINGFCGDGSATAGRSGTVSWCPSPQVEASIHVVCGSTTTPTLSPIPRAGATCTAPSACTAGSGPTVIRNSSEVTDGSDASADTFSGNASDWNIIIAGGISCTPANDGRLVAVMQGGPVDTIKGTVFRCQSGRFRELWSQDYWGGWNNVSVTSVGASAMGIASGYHADPGVIPSLYRPRSPISNTAGLTDWDDQPGTNKGADYFWFATWVCGGGSGGGSTSQPIRATGFFGAPGSWWTDALEANVDIYSSGSFSAGPVRHFLGACPGNGYPAASSYNLYDVCVSGTWPPSGNASCSIPAGRSFSWSNSDPSTGVVRNCSGTVPTARTVASGATFDVTGSPSTNRGTFSCVNGKVVVWPTWSNCM